MGCLKMELQMSPDLIVLQGEMRLQARKRACNSLLSKGW